MGAEVVREGIINLIVAAPNKVISANATIFSNSSNPSGINFPTNYIYYGYDKTEILAITDVENEADVRKPLKVSWQAICV
ncbi:hypothetical protein [uncultured Veillonella sp.]|uniref:hypothetical protein n=1 Tax=uncultured Veillonella sp. TaxID=159268 RepID=UPI00258A46F2|nr:hypothetical protein [uncultured Veillonella sp.]